MRRVCAMLTGLCWVAAAQAASQQQCAATSAVPAGFGKVARAGMVRVPAGALQLGARGAYADEEPNGPVLRVPAFWMDRTEVTNAQFAAFVRATGYRTEAEREGAAAVFQVPARGRPARGESPWWTWRAGASWRAPFGPGGPAAQPGEPVVMVTQADALAYARWLGRDLPTEAEWELAARGGGKPELVAREPRDTKGRPSANYWQGLFPDVNTNEDGYARLAPAGCFPANGYGLQDMIGNVWELTKDAYTGPHQPHGNGDPSIAARNAGQRAGVPANVVIKGGSFLCAANYCMRYRAAARHPHEANLATSHVGFRTVVREAEAKVAGK